MLANVFSNTTTPRVEKAEGVPLLGLALSLCLMAAIAALAFIRPPFQGAVGICSGFLLDDRRIFGHINREIVIATSPVTVLAC
jgi:hypothetical protein